MAWKGVNNDEELDLRASSEKWRRQIERAHALFSTEHGVLQPVVRLSGWLWPSAEDFLTEEVASTFTLDARALRKENWDVVVVRVKMGGRQWLNRGAMYENELGARCFCFLCAR